MGIELINIHGVGETTARKLKRQGIWNTYDLVSYLPKKYQNFALASFDELKHGEIVTVQGIISGPVVTIKKKAVLTTTYIDVDGQTIKLLIYGREYLSKTLKEQDKVLVQGKFNLFTRELNVNYITERKEVPEIKPVYMLEGITDTQVSKILEAIFNEDQDQIYETLPRELISKYHLLERKQAIYKAHFPKHEQDIKDAFLRFKREEAFNHQLSYLFTLNPKNKRQPIPYKIDMVRDIIDGLPFQLTFNQQEAVNDIYKDFKKTESSYRLIQGDVGSGKTIVSFLGAIGMMTAGYQVAMMAPTEILARQHYENFSKLFPEFKSCLLTSSLKDKKDIQKDILDGKYQMIIGTHVLGMPLTRFNNLGLVIIDEQHKFGVELRDSLIQKSITGDLIYLTATPIPRSLSLTFFGDLEVSSIKMRPTFQKITKTIFLKERNYEEIIRILKDTQSKDEQSFIVAPAILESKDKDSVESLYAKLSPFFNEQDFYVIHGKMSSDDIELVMSRFIENKKGILLSTTIIEVGIDVKNATTMLIVGADAFGLSQLHQLRGRIGRGEKPGTCYIVSEKQDSERLNFFEQTTDGFLLSEYDLKLRGPGIFSGVLQSGQVKFNYLDFSSDLKILIEMKNDAKYYLKNLDKYPYLKKRITNIVI